MPAVPASLHRLWSRRPVQEDQPACSSLRNESIVVRSACFFRFEGPSIRWMRRRKRRSFSSPSLLISLRPRISSEEVLKTFVSAQWELSGVSVAGIEPETRRFSRRRALQPTFELARGTRVHLLSADFEGTPGQQGSRPRRSYAALG